MRHSEKLQEVLFLQLCIILEGFTILCSGMKKKKKVSKSYLPLLGQKAISEALVKKKKTSTGSSVISQTNLTASPAFRMSLMRIK